MKKGILQYLAMACVVVSLSLLAGGCAKQKVQSDKDMAGGAAPVGQEESLASKWVGGDSGAVLEGRTTAPMLPIYFDFDKSDIRADQKDRITKNGELLIARKHLCIINLQHRESP